MYFLPKPTPENDTIHHKNSNRQFNDVDNLQWLSRADNVRIAHQQKREVKKDVYTV